MRKYAGVLMLFVVLVGCGPARSDVDAGFHSVREERREKVRQEDDTILETEVITESFAKGPTYTTQGQNLDLGETSVSADAGIATARSKFEAVFKPLRNQPWLIWIGAGVMIASVIAVWLTKSWMLGALGSALGMCLIGLAFYPVIAGIAAATLLVAIVIFVVIMIRREIRDRSALVKIVQAVDQYEKSAPISETAKLHSLLSRGMDKADKAVVAEIKHGQG